MTHAHMLCRMLHSIFISIYRIFFFFFDGETPLLCKQVLHSMSKSWWTWAVRSRLDIKLGINHGLLQGVGKKILGDNSTKTISLMFFLFNAIRISLYTRQITCRKSRSFQRKKLKWNYPKTHVGISTISHFPPHKNHCNWHLANPLYYFSSCHCRG